MDVRRKIEIAQELAEEDASAEAFRNSKSFWDGLDSLRIARNKLVHGRPFCLDFKVLFMVTSGAPKIGTQAKGPLFARSDLQELAESCLSYNKIITGWIVASIPKESQNFQKNFFCRDYIVIQLADRQSQMSLCLLKGGVGNIQYFSPLVPEPFTPLRRTINSYFVKGIIGNQVLLVKLGLSSTFRFDNPFGFTSRLMLYPGFRASPYSGGILFSKSHLLIRS